MLEPAAPAEDLAALVVLRTAFEIELSGAAFYRRAAEQSPDPALKDVFGRLAVMEEEHMATLVRRYHVAPPEPPQQFRPEVAALYAGLHLEPGDPAGLLRVAMAFEERAAAFFNKQAALAQAGSAEHWAYRAFAAEEREHLALLRTHFQRWQSGKPGLL
jgi:rubrerythrin